MRPIFVSFFAADVKEPRLYCKSEERPRKNSVDERKEENEKSTTGSNGIGARGD